MGYNGRGCYRNTVTKSFLPLCSVQFGFGLSNRIPYTVLYWRLTTQVIDLRDIKHRRDYCKHVHPAPQCLYQIGPGAQSFQTSQLTCVSVKILTDVILVFCLHSIFKANPYTRKPSNHEFARTV